MSELDNKATRANLVGHLLTKVQKACERSVVSIVGLRSEDPTVEGTGTLITFGQSFLLLTAAHVLTEIETTCEGMAFSNGHMKPYARFRGMFMGDRSADVAFGVVPNPIPLDSDRIACPEKSLAASSEYSERDLFFFYGFPGEGSRFSALLNGLRTKPLIYAGKPTRSDDPNFNASLHLATSFDTVHCIEPDGEASALPGPGGMSGGAVWRIPWKGSSGGWSPADSQIVGVNVMFDQRARCIIAARIEHVLALVRGGGRFSPILFG